MGSVLRARFSKVALLMAALLAAAPAALAHNEPVHQRMTDFAYHVLVAAAAYLDGGPQSDTLLELMQELNGGDAAMKTFLRDAARAKTALQKLRSGLPEDPTPCLWGPLRELFAGGAPTWNLSGGRRLEDMPMSEVWLPVRVHYGHNPVLCAIDDTYEPSGELASVNPGGLLGRDHTGVTLGYWSAAPDLELEDWALRSTVLGALPRPLAVGAAGAGTTVSVSALCAWACSFLPISCLACPAIGVGTGGKVIDEITSIDADAMEHHDFVGFGHFIDMKPSGPGFFDEKPAKLFERAGPSGEPDIVESVVAALLDAAGVHVNHDASLAPKHYQIGPHLGAADDDFHADTIRREKAQWEAPTAAHLQLTALDNLGHFGYRQARALNGSSKEAYRLGWPLHALGDASVPMHTVGASGFGHRPYEDLVDATFDELVGSNDVGLSLATIRQVLERGLYYRQLIQNWRVLHNKSEVPVRDLVTAVAAATLQKASASPWIFKPEASLLYLANEGAAQSLYDNPAAAAVQRELLIEGIAAELAFLVSYTEVVP